VLVIKALYYIVDGLSISGRLCYFMCLCECGVPQLEKIPVIPSLLSSSTSVFQRFGRGCCAKLITTRSSPPIPRDERDGGHRG